MPVVAGCPCDVCGEVRRKGIRMRRCAACAATACRGCCGAAPDCEGAGPAAAVQAAPAPAAPEVVPPPPAAAAAPAAPETPEELDLLERAAAQPALRTLTWCPKRLESQFADLAAATLQAAVVEATWRAAGDPERRRACLRVWLLPALLLRAPAGEAGPRVGCESGHFATAQLIQGRLCAAERGEWSQLAESYLEELAAAAARPPRQQKGDLTAERHQKWDIACRKVSGGCLRSAAQILTGAGKAPETEATFEKLAALVAAPATPAQVRATADSCNQVFSECAPAKTTRRKLLRRVRLLRRGAEPGPSGWRNSHIAALAKKAAGAQALQAWTETWAAGSFASDEMQLWASVSLAALDRGNGKVRPIALGEALAKLSMGVVVDSMRASLPDMFRRLQLSVGTPGGAELLARAMRGWLASLGGDVVLQLDLANAYGAMFRAHALKATAARLPELARPMAAMWRPGTTAAWARVAGEWRSIPTERGTWQGGPESNIVFCCSLEAAYTATALSGPAAIADVDADLEATAADAVATAAADVDLEAAAADAAAVAAAAAGDACHDDIRACPRDRCLVPGAAAGAARITRTAYADDSFLIGPASCIAARLPALVDRFAEAGQTVQLTKCALWLAEGVDRGPAEEAAIRQLEQLVGPRTAGLTLMGTEATADFMTPLADCDALALTTKRADAATHLAEELSAMAASNEVAGTRAAAWVLLTKVAARALDYDVRVLAPAVAQPQVERLSATLQQHAALIAGAAFDPDAAAQAQLPGALGGCALRLPTTIARAAYWSSWEGQAAALRDLDVSTRRGDRAAADAAAAAAAEELLREHGLILEPGARPAATPEAAAEMTAGPWPAPPVHHDAGTGGARMLSRALQHTERRAATRLWQRLAPPDRARLLACGGLGTGSTWAAAPVAHNRLLPNLHFRLATCMRLGTLRPPPMSKCCLPRRGRPCGAQLDPRLLHIAVCVSGTARQRRHRAIQRTLGAELEAAGGCVDYERCVGKLGAAGGDGSDCRMDITCWFPGVGNWHLIDVTVRSPGAARVAGAAEVPGAAGAAGEREKLSRYGPEVSAVAFETYGRLPDASISVLLQLAGEAAAANPAVSARALYGRWRQRLERELLFACADVVHLGLLGTGEQPVARRGGGGPAAAAAPPAADEAAFAGEGGAAP